MNNLIKIVINTGYNSNKKLLLRLCYNADCVRNFKNLSKKETSNKIINSREKAFNRFLNIRNYGQQLCNAETLSVEKNNEGSVPYITEDQHARNLFESSIHYTKTILPLNRHKVIVTNEEAQQILDKDWTMAELHDLVSTFKRLSYNIMSSDIRIDEYKYTNIFNTLNTRIPDLNDELLEEVLKSLIPFRKHTTINLKKTFNLLDIQCSQRFTKWSIDKMLLISDIFYCLNIHKETDFIWKLMRRINTKLNKLTAKNLVQLMFLVNVTRKSELNLYEVETRLEQHINDISIDELGIIAMGYFKSKSKIRNNLFLRVIINRLICELDKVDTFTFGALLKLIRYSMQYNEIVHFRMLLNSILPYIPNFALMCLTHVAHASAKAGVYEKPVIDAIIERMCNEIKCARIKDIERIVYMLSTLDYDGGHPVFSKIVEEITERVHSDRKQEILSHAHVLPTLLIHLAVKDIYSLDLLQIVMSPSYMERIHRGNISSLGFSYCLLQYFVQIDRPEYTGPFLPEGICRTMTKLHWKFGDKETTSGSGKLFNEIVYTLQANIMKDVDLYIGKVLPHIIPNFIVIGIDENQNYVSAKPILSELSDFTIKRVDDTFPKNVKWIAFTIINYGSKIKGTNKPRGMVNAKLRHMERIGYKPILITDDDWLSVPPGKLKVKFLQDLLKRASCT